MINLDMISEEQRMHEANKANRILGMVTLTFLKIKNCQRGYRGDLPEWSVVWGLP